MALLTNKLLSEHSGVNPRWCFLMEESGSGGPVGGTSSRLEWAASTWHQHKDSICCWSRAGQRRVINQLDYGVHIPEAVMPRAHVWPFQAICSALTVITRRRHRGESWLSPEVITAPRITQGSNVYAYIHTHVHTTCSAFHILYSSSSLFLELLIITLWAGKKSVN